MNICKAKCIIFFAIYLLCSGEGSNPECDSWNNAKRIVENDFNTTIKCMVLSDCTGLDCVGKYKTRPQGETKSFDFNISAQIKPCNKPAIIDLFINIPNTELQNVTHTLRDGDRYKIPGWPSLGLYVEVSLKEKAGRKVNVDLKLNAETKTIKPITILSNFTIMRAQCNDSKAATKKSGQHKHNITPKPQIITTKSCKNCSKNEDCIQLANGDSVCHCKKNYTLDEFNVCNEVAFNQTGKKCNTTELDQCDENESCKEDYFQSPSGYCVCLPDFHEDSQHRCIEGKIQPVIVPESNVSLILSIVLPLCFLLLIAACVFVMIKQKIFQRLRDRFRSVTRYEIVSIGNDEDDDDPLVV